MKKLKNSLKKEGRSLNSPPGFCEVGFWVGFEEVDFGAGYIRAIN